MTSANPFSTDGAAPTPVSPLRVMMVCTGNICRSPMAEIVLRARLREQSLDDRVVVDSTGISSEEHGEKSGKIRGKSEANPAEEALK